MAARVGIFFYYGLCFAFLALAGTAYAHGPVRQKLTEKILIDAPPAKVWGVIGSFQDMSWLPGVAKTTGEGGNTPDAAKRQLVLDNGGTIDESLYKYDAAEMSYAYRIDKVDVKVLPVTNYSATIVVLPADGGKSTVEWRGAFYRGYPNNDPPPDLSDEAAIKAVGTIYKAGLEALKKKVEATK
jgi:hypothetical protein